MRVFLRRNAAMFSVGALGYCTIELIWRQHTHWSMGLAGGVCLIGLREVERRMKKRKLSTQCLAGSALITSVELLTGLWVNRVMGWAVWDYSNMPLNVMGQICPLYSGLWFLLCMPRHARFGRLGVRRRDSVERANRKALAM